MFPSSALSVALCLAVAVCSSEALRLPIVIKPPQFIQNQVDQWTDEAQDLKDQIQQDLQDIRDKWEDLLNCIGGNKETTTVPKEDTTLAPVEETTTTAAAATTPVNIIIFTNPFTIFQCIKKRVSSKIVYKCYRF